MIRSGSMRRSSGKGLLLLLLAVAVLALMPHQAACAGSDYKKQILVLHSYHQGYKWTDDITRGIESVLKPEKHRYSVHYEYMDTKRLSDERYFELLRDIYGYKFKNARFDLIFSTDNDAFNFLVRYRDGLFSGTPVVFCGVNNFDQSMLRGRKLFTGVNEETEINATIDLALKLHPNARRVVVINDTTITGLAMHERLMDAVPEYRGKVEFDFWEDLEMPDLLAKAQKLGTDTVVLYTFFFRDKAGRFFDYDESISMIARNCKAPIYSFWDFNLGYGVVGGMMSSGYRQGETAARIAVNILRGEKIDETPILMKSPNRYMFDYQQLERFGLAFAPLPDGSLLINRPAPIYQISKTLFWVMAVIFTILTGISIIILRRAFKRKEGQEE